MKNEVLLSIICPIYNAEDSIEKLIESIIHQKYDNYELILVNDGSTDNTISIIKKYEKKCKKIVVIDKENTGVCDSRNVGMSASKGKYVTFLDSDDFFSDDYFNKIIPHVEKEDFELLYFNAFVYKFNKVDGCFLNTKKDVDYFNDNDGLKKYLTGDFSVRLGNAPWNKIYVSKIIKDNNIKFEKEQKRGTDLLFNMSYVSHISKYKFVNEKLYYYVYDFNMFEPKKNKNNSITENLKYYEHVIKYCKESNLDDYMRYVGVFYLDRLPNIILAQANNQNYKIGRSNLKNYFKNNKIINSLKCVKFKDLNRTQKFIFFMYKLRLYYFVYFITYFISKISQSRKRKVIK